MASAAARILVAEDDESLRNLLVRYLTSLGHAVDPAADGRAAVEALQRRTYDLVLTDMLMPGPNGLAILRAAKAGNRYTEVIVLTGAPDLATTVQALREGDAFDYIIKPFPNVEILRATTERALERAALRAEVDRLRRELEQRTTTDPLTGALNRRAFFETGEREFARAARHRAPLSLVMLDIDRFKDLEEQVGPAVADAAVVALVGVIRAQMRTEDVLGRYWADKFVCLLPETALLDAHTMAERIRWTLAAEELRVEGAAVPVRISAGVAMRRDADGSLDTMVRRAERALRRSKEAGGNRVSLEQ
jgi:diguanylate cyclase (GGDEF)-like protein